jgi:hypothetical protein
VTCERGRELADLKDELARMRDHLKAQVQQQRDHVVERLKGGGRPR